MHSLQPCQLGNDSLLNMVPIPPLWAMRGGDTRWKGCKVCIPLALLEALCSWQDVLTTFHENPALPHSKRHYSATLAQHQLVLFDSCHLPLGSC